MSTPKKTPAKTARDHDMRGEGHGSPIAASPNLDGTTNFSVHLGSLPAPEKNFSADGLSIVQTAEGFRMIFIRSKLSGLSVRALVDIDLSNAAAHGFITSLKELTRKEGPAVDMFELAEEPESSLALSANFVRVASNSFGSVLDFYYASPFSMEQAGKSSTMYFRDVLRIYTSEGVFFALVKYFLNIEGGEHA